MLLPKVQNLIVCRVSWSSNPPPGDYFATEAQRVPTPTSIRCMRSVDLTNLKVAMIDQVSGRTQAKMEKGAMEKMGEIIEVGVL